jgi:Glycine cleavage H-protein
MLPWVYEFRWEPAHIIFLGLFFSVAVSLACTLVLALRRTMSDFRSATSDQIIWKVTFEDLTAAMKQCRHAFTGELKGRVCSNGFDCRSCQVHQLLRRTNRPATGSTRNESVGGLEIRYDRSYHRGHTWVQQDDGTLVVGLDELACRLIGRPDAVELPAVGSQIRMNGIGWRVRKGNATAHILAPVDGEVVATGGPDQGWFLRVRSPRDADYSHLLQGTEVKAWFMHELERLQWAVSTTSVGRTLADGGSLVSDIPDALSGEFSTVWDEMFLQS